MNVFPRRVVPGTLALFLAACAGANPASETSLSTVTPVPFQTRGPSPILPTPDEAATPLPPVAPLGLVRLWQFDLGGIGWATALTDLTTGGYPDILVTSEDKTLYALDGEGGTYWQLTADGPPVSLTSADLDGEAPREIITGGDDQKLRALSPEEGQALWEFDAGARVGALVAGDLNGDGLDEVIAGLWGGEIVALGPDNALLWRVETADGGDPTALALADLDGDSTPEVLVATAKGTLEVLDAAGQRRWAVDGGTSLGDMAPFDLDGGGRPEIVVATRDGDLLAFESDGNLRWSLAVGVRLTSLLVADLDGEERAEVLVGGGPAPGRVVMADAEGRPLWSIDLPGGVRSLAAGDLDEEGLPELVVGSDDGLITLLDRFGQTRGTYPTHAPVTRLHVARFASGAPPDVLAQSGDRVYLLRAAPGSGGGDPPTPGPETLPAAPEDTFHLPGADEVELVFAGDVMLSGGIVQSTAAYGPIYPFEGTASLLSRADVAVANLDGVLAVQGEGAALPTLHHAPPSLAEGLQWAGVDVAWLANDHALDYGQAALDETVASLAEHGVRTAGVGADRDAAEAPTIIAAKGLSIAFVAFADGLPQGWSAGPTTPGIAAADTGRIAQAVRNARQQADAVIVGLHAGQAGASTPNARQEALARAAIDAGAALVVGYGPGVVQEAGVYRSGFIAYSLGNFATDEPNRDGALLRMVLSRDGLKTVDLVPVHAGPDGGTRLLAEENDLPTVQRLYPLGVTFQSPRLNANPGPTPDYRLDVTLDYDAKRLDVTQAVTARNDSADTWEEMVFAVLPHYFEDVFELNGVRSTNTSSQRIVDSDEIELEESETFLRVPLPVPVPPGEFVTVELDYTLFLPPIYPADWQPFSTLGFDETLIQTGEWYPTLVPYVDGEGWHTWTFYPVGDPILYQLADYDMTIHAPLGVTVASGGQQGEAEEGVWRFHLEDARGVAFLASPTFRCVSREVDGVMLRSCFQLEHDLAGRDALDMLEEAITLYGELFGPYHHDDLVIAENGYYGAMEYSGTLSITEPAYEMYSGQPDSLLGTLIVHEVAHQWWYDAVGNNQITEPWLDESLATYSELLYYEHYYPDLTAWWWNYRVLQYEPSGPVDVTIYDYDLTEPFVRNMYGQAAFFIQDLRRTMGDEAFFAFLRDYYQVGTGRIMTADDFFAVARRHTDADLSALLAGYFRNPDH